MNCDVVPVAAPAGSILVAVAGNPNTGKSSLFNSLTGVYQQVGNYPGITVERKSGSCRLDDAGSVTLLDLPGTYSLAAGSPDEQVVIDVLSGRQERQPRPNAILVVVDASNLRRNLFLVTQLAETGLPLVVALNMMDEAEQRGLRINADELSRRLGVAVVPTVASKGRGMTELRAAIRRALNEAPAFRGVAWPPAVEEARRGLEAAAGPGRTVAELHRLLFDMEPGQPLNGLGAAREAAHRTLEAAGLDPVSAEALLRYRHIDGLLKDVVIAVPFSEPRKPYAIDRILTHRVAGMLIFAAIMFAVFSSIYWIAKPVMEGIGAVTDAASAWAALRLEAHPMLQSLIADGVFKGVGGVIVFLPQILILFFFVAVLEDSGYMARAAFLMDKVFAWTGLNGKSFVPMLSSFACAVPSILATRTIEDPRARLSTILVAPLMSCSARLPVYVLMIGTFIAPKYGPIVAGAALFAMHLLGLAVAIPIAFVINRFLLKVRTLPFILEMPPYRRPQAKTVFRRMFLSGREFVVRAGTVIFAFSVVIWALSYFPRPEGLRERIAAASPGLQAEELDRLEKSASLEQSFMGRFGKAVQPVFGPAGFDWKITVGVLAAFPAREVIVSTLGIIYAVETKEKAALKTSLAAATWPDGRPVYTPAVAVAVMVFFAFCLQCGSTVAVIARESNWKWAGFAFVYMTSLAWIAAVATYQVGVRL